MELTSIPIILVTCYLFGEIFKIAFKNKRDLFKLIPVFVTLLGGAIAILIFYTGREILNVSNVYNAILIGFTSGASATGTNQIVKQLFKSTTEENDSQGGE